MLYAISLSKTVSLYFYDTMAGSIIYLFLNKLTFTDRLKRFAKTLFKNVRHHLYDIK
jgi:hypothetical protein